MAFRNDTRRVARRLLSATLLCALGACADASNSAAVYEETLSPVGLPGDRAEAYRVTLFEYSSTVGGFIERFEIDGVRNTHANPYFASAECAYFGAGRIENDEFPIVADFGDGRMEMRAALSNRDREMTLAFDRHAEAPLVFERTDFVPRRACPEPR